MSPSCHHGAPTHLCLRCDAEMVARKAAAERDSIPVYPAGSCQVACCSCRFYPNGDRTHVHPCPECHQRAECSEHCTVIDYAQAQRVLHGAHALCDDCIRIALTTPFDEEVAS